MNRDRIADIALGVSIGSLLSMFLMLLFVA
jgi:hypothetical protein